MLDGTPILRRFPGARWVFSVNPVTRFTLLVFAYGLYIFLYLELHNYLGDEATIVAFIPVAISGVLLGFWGGALSSFLVVLTQLYLLNLYFVTTDSSSVRPPVILIFLIIIIGGVLVGRLSDVGQRLRTELQERRRTEADLKGSKERYQSLFDGVPVGLYRTTPLGLLLDANPALVEMLRYPDLAALASIRVADLYVSAEDRSQEMELLQKKGLVHNYDMRLYCLDGSIIWVRDSVRAVKNESGEVIYCEGSLEDITELKRIEQAELEQRILSEALRDSADALNSTLQFDEVLDRILINVGRVVLHDAANIMLVKDGFAQIERSQGYTNDWNHEERLSSRFPIETMDTLRYMAESGKPLAIPDTSNYPGWIDLPHSLWLRSYAGAPILVKGHLVGFLNLNSSTVGFYTPEKAEHLQAFANQAAVAIENARLFAELQDFARQKALLNDITRAAISAPNLNIMLQRLADRLGELICVDGALITLWDAERGEPVPAAAYGPQRLTYRNTSIQVGELTMTASVLKAGKPLVAEDIFQSPHISPRIATLFSEKSVLGLPLIADGKKLGAALITFRETHHFSDAEVSLCEQAANQIALAMAKAQLLETERERLKELRRANIVITAFSKVATQVVTVSELSNVLRVLGDGLDQLGIDCLVAIKSPKSEHLAIKYLTLKENELRRFEQIVGQDSDSSSLLTERFPFYEEVIQQELPIFSTELESITENIFPNLTGEQNSQVIELLGLNNTNKGFVLPLSAGGQILGALLMWGKDLEESDLPAASLFAGQVAVALENAHLYARIQHMAVTDELTGLYNRRGLFEISRREVDRAKRYRHSLAVIMIDIDHFKMINDKYSHAIGDLVLRSFAECCVRNVREIDIVGRVGGEEFVILLPETNLSACKVVAERLRKKIVENRTVTNFGGISITVSMGVAAISENVRDLSDLLRQADEALYIAKTTGRDRVAAGLSSADQ